MLGQFCLLPDYYPLQLSLAIPVLYFVFASVCIIALGVPIVSFPTAMRLLITTALRPTARSSIAIINTALGVASAVRFASMAIVPLLWVVSLFLLSAAMGHGITILGARYTTSMLIWAGILWSFPATADYVDRTIAGFLLFLLHALQGYVRCGAAIMGLASSISKIILAAMQQITCKRIYQVMAVLGLGLLYVYITLAALFLSIPIVLAVSYSMQSPVIVLYYLLCLSIMAYIAPELSLIHI